jgi:hypothetical protein
MKNRETRLPKIHKREFGKSKVYLSVNLRKSNSKDGLNAASTLSSRDISLPKLERPSSEATVETTNSKSFELITREKSIGIREPVVAVNEDKSKMVKSTSHAPNSRLAYMVLSLLSKRDVFGLDHLENDETMQRVKQRSNRPGKKADTTSPGKIILISEDTGAEVIVVNKRFFCACADVTTLVKIDKLVRFNLCQFVNVYDK